MEAKPAVATPSTIMPPADSYAVVPPMISTSAGDSPHQHQHRQPNKRKAEDADLDAATAAAVVSSHSSPAYPAPMPLAAAVTGGLVTPPPPALPTAPTSVIRQGSCAEMAIALDDSSSDEGEDVTDVPVDVGTAATSTAASATTAAALAAAAASAAASRKTAASAAASAASRAAAAPGARLSIRLPSKALQNATGASANRASGGGRASSSYTGQAAAASSGYGQQHHQGLKLENGAVGGGSSRSGSSPPSSKRNKAGAAVGATGGSGGARQRGRPVGSKNRSSDEDPPYVATNPSQRAAAGSSGDDDGPIASSRPRRRCEPRQRWADQMMNPGEQWARKVPKSARPLPTNPVEASIPDAPTFYPTEEQFRDPLKYIESIRPTAESYGIAKIVPPLGWKPPPTPLGPHTRKLLPTKKQALHSLMNSDEVYDDGKDYTILDYKLMADKVEHHWRSRDPPAQKPRAPPRYEPMGPNVEIRPGSSQEEIDAKIEENGRLRLLEREYWNVVDGGVEELEVEYANDLNISDFWSGFPMPEKNFMDGRAFDRTRPCDFDDPEYYRTCGWNLNNLPFWPGSVLRFFRTHINGLTAPWLYLGMQYATFAWHNEDNYLYSLNYHHSGSPKQWYGIPGKHAKGFEKCLAKILGETLETVSEHLYRITKMLSPVYLQEAGVPVCRLQQHPGQFVVTFPKAYHGGFSYGFNCGEAVNFAVPDWISYSRESTEAYRSAQRMAALSHDKMVATLTMYLPDHDVKGCELVVRELRRIHQEELEHRVSLEQRGVQDPARQGVPLPRFRLGLIEQDTEEYDERRVCKTCKHTLFMTGVACPCSDVDVSCLRCVEEACDCPVDRKYLLSWWTEDDLSRFVRTAEDYLRKLANGQATEAAKASFRSNINPF